MLPRLFAFDLDGTLLNSQKRISEANAATLIEMRASGAIVALASGRLGSSMVQYVNSEFDLPMLTLNGAAVYMGGKDQSKLIYHAPLDSGYADHLINYASGKNFALNYYINDKLYAVKNETTSQWLDLYFHETSTPYNFITSYKDFAGQSPSKMLFIGDPAEIDRQEAYFNDLWKDSIYICRTWDHYLEFLNPDANKGKGLQVLADAYNIDPKDIVAFGDAANDIPMLKNAGLGIAMQNATDDVKLAAGKVSNWTNDEDGVTREWEIIRGRM
jgi:Cof subfamily protein (haloacid dehalogenase superfamily)